MNRAERGERARRAVRRRVAQAEPEPEPFRVLIAVHRPRCRSRAERAVEVPGWEVRSLLNREDPIGLINRKPPHLLILSDDFGRNRDLGYMRAAQRWRGAAMRIIGLFETEEDAGEAAGLCDAVLFPPWQAADLRAIAERFFAGTSGEPLPPVETIDNAR